MNKIAVVTGANGFVGTRLCRQLLSVGFTVVGTDITSLSEISHSSFEYYSADITSFDGVENVFRLAGSVTHVFHLAAITFVPDSVSSPVNTMNVNINGTINVVEAVKKHCPQACLLFVGSSEVYGPPERLPVTEAHPLNPSNPYAVSKLAADLYCRCETAKGMNIVRVRPFNHSGAGQKPLFVLSDFCRQVAMIEAGLQKPVISVGNLSAARDFTHVDDVVNAYVMASDGCSAGEVYNICSGKSVVVKELLDRIVSKAVSPVTIEVSPEKWRPVTASDVYGSAALMSETTGWQPEKNVNMIIDDLLSFWRDKLAQTEG